MCIKDIEDVSSINLKYSFLSDSEQNFEIDLTEIKSMIIKMIIKKKDIIV